MNQRFVVDGSSRFLQSKEFKDSCDKVRREVESRYSREFASAGWFGKLPIRYRMHREYRQRVDEMMPSPAALWFGNEGISQRTAWNK